jgi:hypothetical protein
MPQQRQYPQHRKELFEKPIYENKRKNLILILKSLSILCQTFMIIIQKIKFMVNPNNSSTLMPLIASEMFEAINYYSRVISYNIDEKNETIKETINTIYEQQKTLFLNIKIDLTTYIRESVDSETGVGNEVFDFSIYYNNEGNAIDSRNRSNIQQQMEHPDYEVRRQQNATRLRELRDRAIANYNARQALRQEAREARQAARTERQAAREAEMIVRIADRAARVTTRPSRVQQQEFIITPEMIKDVDSSEFSSKILEGDIHNKFKTESNSIIRKLQNSYNKYNREFNREEDRIAFYKQLRKKYQYYFNRDERVTPLPRIQGNVINYVGYSVGNLFIRYVDNGFNMKFNDLDKYFVVNYSVNRNADGVYTSTTRQAGIDAGGLRRDFITALTTELFNPDIGIFIKREGSKKYFLNPNFKPNDIYLQIAETFRSRGDGNHPLLYEKYFHKFLAELLSFILVNDCGLEHHISSYLVASLTRKPDESGKVKFEKEDYLYFMYEDFPEYTATIINLMKMSNPAEIEYVCIGINDYFNLTSDPNEELKEDNIEDFLYNTAKFMMKKTVLRKGLDVRVEDYDEVVKKGKYIHKKFVKNVPSEIRDYLSDQKVPLKAINSYLVKPTMSLEIIGKLKENFKKSMNKAIAEIRNQARKDEVTKLKELFLNYVLEKQPGVEEVDYFKFIDNLIRFWSGSSFYKDNVEYSIQNNNTLSADHLPQSHTCFFLIDIPPYTGVNDEEIGLKLYNKISIAITNVEAGLGLMGGKGKNPAKKPAKPPAKPPAKKPAKPPAKKPAKK